jgi:hypothetical protein
MFFNGDAEGLATDLKSIKKNSRFVPATVLHQWDPRLEQAPALEETHAGRL